MRLITKLVPIIFMGLMLFGISSPVRAEFNPWGDFKFPEVKPPALQVGQSASYKINVAGVPEAPGPVNASLRMAVVGKETIEGSSFYWFELDIGDIAGLPPEAAGFVSSFKLKALVKDIPQEKYKEDPKALMKEFARGNIMRKLVFQIDDKAPQMIDFMTLQGLAQALGGMDLESLVDEIPFDEMEENPENPMKDMKFNCGSENVSVSGKAYNNASFCTFEGTDEEEKVTFKGKTYMHESVPIGAFLKMAFDVHNAEKNEKINLSMELIDYKTAGATSQIIGEPVPFDFGALMGGMAGGMPPMGGME
ncbi:MAG: hypothetical protein ABIG42_01410 [bacterium]